jgi:hypothetical protein
MSWEKAKNAISAGRVGAGGVISVVVGTDNATIQGQSNDNVAKRVQGNLIQQLYNDEVHTTNVDREVFYATAQTVLRQDVQNWQ